MEGRQVRRLQDVGAPDRDDQRLDVGQRAEEAVAGQVQRVHEVGPQLAQQRCAPGGRGSGSAPCPAARRRRRSARSPRRSPPAGRRRTSQSYPAVDEVLHPAPRVHVGRVGQEDDLHVEIVTPDGVTVRFTLSQPSPFEGEGLVRLCDLDPHLAKGRRSAFPKTPVCSAGFVFSTDPLSPLPLCRPGT